MFDRDVLPAKSESFTVYDLSPRGTDPHPENHPAEYQEHALQSHDTELAYPCEHPGCDLVLASEKDLKRHSRIHKSKKPFECLYCDALFASKYDRAQHIRDKQSNKMKHSKWRCPDADCNDDYSSSTLASVFRHNNTTHRGILHRCLHAGCIKRYTSPENLANHAVIHQTGILECPMMCGKKVIDIKNHLRKFHNLSGDALKEMMKLLKKK
ncbi:hypothetical protein BC940DRAFT_142976 [Gongronella butleri]|nr:hypothetical protein BC940DRAFT_142976 [Gongronella butleri]